MPTSVVPEPVDTWLQRGKSCLPSVVPHCWTWNRQEKSPTNPEERFVVVMKPKACPDESLDHCLSRQEVRYRTRRPSRPPKTNYACRQASCPNPWTHGCSEEKSCLPSVVPHCWTWNRQEKSPTNPEERFVVVMKPKACPDESLDHSLSRQEVRYRTRRPSRPPKTNYACRQASCPNPWTHGCSEENPAFRRSCRTAGHGTGRRNLLRTRRNGLSSS